MIIVYLSHQKVRLERAVSAILVPLIEVVDDIIQVSSGLVSPLSYPCLSPRLEERDSPIIHPFLSDYAVDYANGEVDWLAGC